MPSAVKRPSTKRTSSNRTNSPAAWPPNCPADQIAFAAGQRPKRRMTFAASAATSVWTWAEIDAVVSCATSGTQRGFFAAASCCSRVMVNGSSGVTSPSTSQPSSMPSFTASAATPSLSDLNPTWILRRRVLLLARDGERIVRRNQPEHVPAVEHAELHRVGGDPELVGQSHRERGGHPGSDLDCLRSEGDAAGSVDLDQREGRIGTAAEHGAHAGEADAIGFVRISGGPAGLFGRAGGPHRLRCQAVEHLAAPQCARDDIADHGLAAGLEQVGLAE